MREVARTLFRRHGDSFSDLALLFPSRRARLFLVEELANLSEGPLWEPEWLSVDGLMEELSGLHLGDRLRLITELYRVYSCHHTEDFDHFYFWGEMLLADFDMIDKYRVDAEMLFCNIADLKQLEADLSYLTEEQRRLIDRFWEGVLQESADTEERRRFLRIWNSLYAIYQEFRGNLFKLGFAYSGMLQREAADRLKRGEASLPTDKRYVVAGFNALSECEKILFDHLRSLGAEFYWDYDNYYVGSEEQEAGMFLRENRSRYPEAEGEITHDNFKENKELQVVSTSSDIVQCKSVSSLLNTFREKDSKGRPLPLDKRTAIVLTDETLLMPLLHALEKPREQERPDAVNVTMGFPVRQSVVYTFVERLLELQSHSRKRDTGYHFYHADVTGLLMHPCLDGVDEAYRRSLQQQILADRLITVPVEMMAGNELIQSIFSPTEDWRSLSDYLLQVLRSVGTIPLSEEQMGLEEEIAEQRVFLSLICEEISKLRNSIDACGLDITTSTYASLLRRHLQTLKIPFEGEPLDGIQVMGILETRNLDFDQVILLSMTDDNFPGRLDAGSSYVPYNLRAAYGLPTPEHHEGVYSYYFYRLIQRAKRVVMCYCSHADDKTTGEPSRYIRQLEYESPFSMTYREVGVDVNLPKEELIEVKKEGSVREALEGYLREENPRKISPTAFARYLACPLKFYFASIARIKEQEEVSEEIDNPLFGTILHASMQRLYARIRGEANPGRVLEAMLRAGEVEQAVHQTICEELFRGRERSESDFPGNLLLARDLVIRYIREGIVAYDRAHEAFVVEGLEKEVACDFHLPTVGRVCLAGTADRIDRMADGTLRVVDYKTGGVHLEFNGLEDLFVSKNRGKNANIFQTLLYSLILHRREGVDARPALYYVRHLNREGYSPYPMDKSREGEVTYALYGEAFEQMLSEKLCELFDYQTPFRPCEDQEMCQFCDYCSICRRS